MIDAAQLARRMLASADPGEIAAILCEGARVATGVPRAGVFVPDGAGWRLAAGEASLAPDPEVAEAAFREAEPVTVPHPGAGIVTVVPMRSGSRRAGLLVLDVSDSELDPARLASVILLAEHAATALSTQRAIAESRDQWTLLHNVLESITNGIVTIDAARRVAVMNRNAAAMLGVETPPAGTPASQVLPSRVGATVDEMIGELLANGFCMERRVTLPSAGGDTLPLAISVTLLRDAGQSNMGFIVVLRDMTASQELERLRHLDELKSQFVANVSHELKTPLTSIKAYTEALLDMVEGEQPQQFLKVIDEESDRLLYLINDLLNVSRIQSGKLKTRLEMTDPAPLVPEAMRIARIPSERHTVETDIAPDLPRMMLDRDKIKEVLINLMSNAVKYSPQGGRIRVRMRRSESNLQIDVQDEGLGIAPENQARLFTPFYRVDNSLTYEVSGTGLGLAIVKAIVDHHGGRVSVDSALGRGSTFTVLLPIRTEARREEEPSLRG